VKQNGTSLSSALTLPAGSAADLLQGCGIVEYEEAPAATAAMQALHTKYHWTDGDTTMVVEWMDPARHRKDKQAQEEGESRLYKCILVTKLLQLLVLLLSKATVALWCCYFAYYVLLL
jgi:hypothetical protein